MLLCACSSLDRLLDEPAPTLANLDPAALPAEEPQLAPLALDELAQVYREALTQQSDPVTRLTVSHRLADIEMLGAEADLAAGAAEDTYFSDSIATYESLLREHPDYPRRDEVLYQLSKAYALEGRMAESQASLEQLAATTPASPYLAEAQFRRAERRFAARDYTGAEALYTQVTAHGAGTPFYTRALYMQGWARFKQDHYRAATEAFTASLDVLLPGDATPAGLPRAGRELVEDSLRILAIMFSKQDGARTIAHTYRELGARHWEYLAYASLGEFYLAQERYDDSAGTFRAFTVEHPHSRRAHSFQLRVIEAYRDAGFERQIVGAKADYVRAFNVTGDYWRYAAQPARDDMAPHLRRFTDELAAHHHALAQAAVPDSDGAAEHYAEAARYYQLYLDSFPDDPEVPRLAFLLAESLFDARRYRDAIGTYEWLAYVHGDTARAADAAYHAVLAYDELEPGTARERDALDRQRIAAELRFFEHFPEDGRAPGVLAHAATSLLQRDDHVAALAASSALVALSPAPPRELLTPGWLVAGHSHFALGDFEAAEQAYREGLVLMAPGDKRRTATAERLAASLYHRGEAARDLGQSDVAANHFLQAMAIAPGSDIRRSAQYDAAQSLVAAGELQEANALLTDFRERYPGDALTSGIGTTLLANHERLGQWREAARELDTLHAAEADPEVARQHLAVAAHYYEKAGDSKTAIARYRSYAHDWPRPVDTNLEAIHSLAALYAEAGEMDKRYYWLRRTMAIHDGAGDAQTDRSRYLAAAAAAELANVDYESFTALALTQPLDRSLPAKRAAMEQALAGFNRCTGYAVAQFATRCTYHLGAIYQQLGSALLRSERPAGLDALALEQYEMMLEEQAFPFEEQAIAIHESNAGRSRQGVYDAWVQQSFTALATLLPARYDKHERVGAGDGEVAGLNTDAIALREQGDFPGAEAAYLAALGADPDHADTHRNLGILYDLYLGVPGRALHHYGRYQALTQATDRRVAGWIADLERRHIHLAGDSR